MTTITDVLDENNKSLSLATLNDKITSFKIYYGIVISMCGCKF